MKRRDQGKTTGQEARNGKLEFRKRFGFDGGDHLAAIRAQGINVEISDHASTIIVDGGKMTAGEFCCAFPWNGRHDPNTTNWKETLQKFRAKNPIASKSKTKGS